MVYTPHSWWFFGMVNCWVLYGFVGFTTLLLNGKVDCFCLLWTHIFWNQFCKSTCNHTYFIGISFITNGPRTRIISSPYSCCLYSMGASWNGWMQLTLELASFMALLHGFAAGWLCSLPLCASTPQYSQSYQTSLAAASTPMPLGAWRSPEVHRWGNTPMDSTQPELTGHLEITTPVPRQAKSCQAFCRSQTAAWSVLGHLSLDPVFGHRRLKSILPATAVLILLETHWDRCTTG